jgi:hypothetical protein
MWDAVYSEGAYEETPGVEGLGRIFSGFSAAGVGGGQILGRNRVPLAGVESRCCFDSQYWRNIILRICIGRRRCRKNKQQQQ